MNELIDMLFTSQDMVGRTINLTILGLFLIGCADVARSLQRLASERRLVKRAREVLKEKSGSLPSGPEDKVVSFLDVAENSLLGKRIARVIRLRSAGLGHREVLQQLTVERIDGYGALARYIGVILTLLGLLGTVVGMSIALYKIQGALQGVDSNASAVAAGDALKGLTQALGGTLQGMKTAFGCTLLGLLTAILLSYLNHVVRRAQSAVVAGLEEFVVCDLLPALEQIDPGADETAKVFARVIAEAADSLGQVRDVVTAAAQQYRAASEQMVQVVESFNGGVQALGQNVSQVIGSQQTFTQTLGETRQAVASLSDVVTRQFDALRLFTGEANQTVEDRLKAVEDITRTNSAIQESLQTLAAKFESAVAGYPGQFKEALDAMFAEFKSSVGKLLEGFSQNYKDGVAGHVTNSQKAFEAALAQHLERLQSMFKEHDKGLSDIHLDQRAALRAFSDMVVDVHVNMGNLFEKLAADGNGHAGRELQTSAGD